MTCRPLRALLFLAPLLAGGLAAPLTVAATGPAWAVPSATTRHAAPPPSARRVAPPPVQARPAGTYAFVGVTVLPMDEERALPGHTVLVEDGLITAVGPAGVVSVPEGATIIDGAGRYLMPGVAEMHGHYPSPDNQELVEAFMFLYVANGVTLVRGMQGGPEHVPLREAIEAREMLGPRLFVSAPMMHGNNVTSPEQAVELVERAHASGVDHLKVHEGLTLPVYDAIAETARGLELPFAGHVSNHVGLYHALDQGQWTVDHLDNALEAMIDDREAVAQADLFGLADLVAEVDYDSQVQRVIDAFLESGAGVVPTMELWEILFGAYSVEEIEADRPEIEYMPRGMVSNWRQAVGESHGEAAANMGKVRAVLDMRRRVLGALHDAGVPVLLGTDSPQIYSVPGFSIHHEMRIMEETGLSPYEILAAGTRGVAEFYRAPQEWGTVERGRRADLVLLNGNPLEDLDHFAHRAGVMVNGQWLPEEAIQARLAEIAAAMSATG